MFILYEELHNSIQSSDWVLPGLDNPRDFVRDRVKELAVRRQALQLDHRTNPRPRLDFTNINFEGAHKSDVVNTAYDRCRKLFHSDDEPFVYGRFLIKPHVLRSLTAIWAWGKRNDEVVDGENGSYATHETLDKMEERLLDIYQGCPHDIYDLALADTVSRFPIDIQLFKDVIDGFRVDLGYKRFQKFDELYLYYYYVGGAAMLMFIQVFGIRPKSTATTEQVYDGMVTLGMAFGFVDMLSDIGPDAKQGRIYFSQDKLKMMDVSEEDIFKGKVTDRWRKLMREQIKLTRGMLDEGAKKINEFDADGRLTLWTALLLYRQDLDIIEANDYDVFTKKSKVGFAKRIAILPLAYIKSLGF